MLNRKILMFANSDWYFELHWLDRALAAKKSGFEVHVLAPQTEEKYKESFEKNGFYFHTLDMHRTSLNLFGEFSVFYQCLKIAKSIQPDIIHTVTVKPNLYMGIVAKLMSIPLVSTFAGLGALSTSKSVKYRLPFMLIKQCLKLVSSNKKYLALFENQEDLNVLVESKSIPENKTKRVYGAGVDTSRFIFKPEDTESLQILFAARLLKDKGLSDLIKAVKLVKQKGHHVTLKVAGIFDEVSPTAYTQVEIENMAKSGDFEWLGKRDDMVELINQSNIICLPTTYGEGVPRILIEASACGRSIVSTSLGGCKDICIDGVTGLQAQASNPVHLAEVLLKLLIDDSLRKSCGEKGRQLVEDKYSNSSIVLDNTNFYLSLMY